jgi:peroxiredoxin
MMAQDRSLKTISVLLIVSNAVLVLCLCATACAALTGFGWLVYALNSVSSASTGADLLVVGQPALDFQLTDLDGRTVSLLQYQGHPVLLNFWAVWCGPCKEEMPLILERYRQYQPDLIVLAVDQGDSAEDVRRYVDEAQLTFPVLLDEASALGELYGIYAYPTTFFVDANGVIQAVEVGSMDETTIDDDLFLVGVP